MCNEENGQMLEDGNDMMLDHAGAPMFGSEETFQEMLKAKREGDREKLSLILYRHIKRYIMAKHWDNLIDRFPYMDKDDFINLVFLRLTTKSEKRNEPSRIDRFLDDERNHLAPGKNPLIMAKMRQAWLKKSITDAILDEKRRLHSNLSIDAAEPGGYTDRLLAEVSAERPSGENWVIVCDELNNAIQYMAKLDNYSERDILAVLFGLSRKAFGMEHRVADLVKELNGKTAADLMKMVKALFRQRMVSTDFLAPLEERVNATCAPQDEPGAYVEERFYQLTNGVRGAVKGEFKKIDSRKNK